MSASVEVILVQDIEGLGEFGQKKTVKAGYARNYLFPQLLAMLATPQNQAYFESFRKKEDKRRLELKTGLEETAKKVNGQALVFVAKTHDEGKLYGSISATDILSQLKEKTGLELERSTIQLAEALKEVGKFEVNLNFGMQVKATISVEIQAEPTEDKKA
jgi:large subunit ribosomal protein L9